MARFGIESYEEPGAESLFSARKSRSSRAVLKSSDNILAPGSAASETEAMTWGLGGALCRGGKRNGGRLFDEPGSSVLS